MTDRDDRFDWEACWAGDVTDYYPTPYHQRELMPKYVDNREEIGFESQSQEWVRDRFRLVLNGENILTEEQIGELLERKPRDIRTFDVEMPEQLGEKFRITVLKK